MGCSEFSQALRKRKQEAQRVDGRRRTLAERQIQAGVFLYDFAESLFDALDANSDARVDLSELLRIVYPLATVTELRTMRNWATPPKTEKQLQEEEAEEAERERLAQLRAMFAAYDRDGDGK